MDVTEPNDDEEKGPKKGPKKGWKKWSEGEELDLLRRLVNGQDIEDIALAMERSIGAIVQRIARLYNRGRISIISHSAEDAIHRIPETLEILLVHRRILIIGAGGIGGVLAKLVSRAAAFSDLTEKCGMVSLTLMDGDIVERRNLSHQQFAEDDVGKPKVEALVRQLRDIGITQERGIDLLPVAENFSDATDLTEYDLVVVAVDREEPRRIVHENAEAWLDLRCRGDGFLMWSYQDDMRVLKMFPPLPDGESASCQLEGAVEIGNIQFGFAEAASHGAQWVIQWLRGGQVPLGRTYSIHMGDLPLPQVTEEEEE